MRPFGPSRQHPKYDHPSGGPGIVVAVGVWLEVVVVDLVEEVLDPKVDVEEVVSTELDVDNSEGAVDVVLDGVDAEVLLLVLEDFVELEVVLDVLDEVVDELVEEDLTVVVGMGWRGSGGGGGGFHWPLKSYTLSRLGPPQISVSLPEQRIVQPLAPALLSCSMLSPQTGHQKVSKRILSLNKYGPRGRHGAILTALARVFCARKMVSFRFAVLDARGGSHRVRIKRGLVK